MQPLSRISTYLLILALSGAALASCSPASKTTPDPSATQTGSATPSSMPAVQPTAESATLAPAPESPTSTQPPAEVLPPATSIPATAVPVPATPQPTDIPPAPTAPANYTETFDQADENWSDPLIVTTQASGRDPFIKFLLAAGRLRFAIQDKETYAYQTLKQAMPGSNSIQVTYENRGEMTYGVAAICKADAAMGSWYEARLVSGESQYNLYRYDKQLKALEKNPYVLLASGLIAPKDFSTAKGGTFTFSCSDSELKLDLDNGKKVITQPVQNGLKGSLVGIGAMSYNLLPVNIEFKTVVIQAQ